MNYDGSSGASERGYKPWGEVRFGPDDLPTGYQYTGQYRDKLIGLYYYGARWYDTTLGRFVQPDSIIVNSENPQSWDRYAYVINNPLKYIDPSGLYASEPLIDGLYSVEYAVNHANEIGECPPGQDPIKSLDDPGWRGWLVTTYSNNKPRLFLSSLQETEEIKSAIINIQIENLSLNFRHASYIEYLRDSSRSTIKIYYFDNENRQFKQYSYRENNHRNYRGINIWNNGLYSFYSYGCSYH